MTRDEAEMEIAKMLAKNKPLNVHIHCPRNQELSLGSWIEFTVALKFYAGGHLLDPLAWDGFRAFGKLREVLDGDYEEIQRFDGKSSYVEDQASVSGEPWEGLQAQSEDQQSY